MAYKGGFYLGGDIHEKAFARAGDNARSIVEEGKQGLQMDVLQWDVMRVPLRTASVDVFVTDLVGASHEILYVGHRIYSLRSQNFYRQLPKAWRSTGHFLGDGTGWNV